MGTRALLSLLALLAVCSIVYILFRCKQTKENKTILSFIVMSFFIVSVYIADGVAIFQNTTIAKLYSTFYDLSVGYLCACMFYYFTIILKERRERWRYLEISCTHMFMIVSRIVTLERCLVRDHDVELEVARHEWFSIEGSIYAYRESLLDHILKNEFYHHVICPLSVRKKSETLDDIRFIVKMTKADIKDFVSRSVAVNARHNTEAAETIAFLKENTTTQLFFFEES